MSTPSGPVPRPLPMLTGRGIDRSRDRAITIAGVTAAAAFLLVSILVAVVPGGSGGPWLPLHLALAGGASVAIAALLPFFAATLVATAPAPDGWRAAAIGLIAAGAALVTGGVRADELGVGAAGGVLYLAGMAVLLALTIRLLRGSLIARRRIFSVFYGAALGCVLVGAALTTLMLAGVPAVLAAWPTLRIAHAWLNLFGFVGLVVAVTLIHLYPTVVGARIEQGRVTVAGLLALTAGPTLVALGFTACAWLPIALGGGLVMAGAVTLVAYAMGVLRRRARWTTDADWHRFTTGSLTCAIGWLAVAQVGAAALALTHGPGPAGWVGGVVVAPLVLGAIVQVIVGSWSHLLPAIGPGSPVRHAWQRRILGRMATIRVVGFQAGVALLLVGALADVQGPVQTAGVALTATTMALSLGLFAIALSGRREGRTDPSQRHPPP